MLVIARRNFVVNWLFVSNQGERTLAQNAARLHVLHVVKKNTISRGFFAAINCLKVKMQRIKNGNVLFQRENSGCLSFEAAQTAAFVYGRKRAVIIWAVAIASMNSAGYAWWTGTKGSCIRHPLRRFDLHCVLCSHYMCNEMNNVLWISNLPNRIQYVVGYAFIIVMAAWITIFGLSSFVFSYSLCAVMYKVGRQYIYCSENWQLLLSRLRYCDGLMYCMDFWLELTNDYQSNKNIFMKDYEFALSATQKKS